MARKKSGTQAAGGKRERKAALELGVKIDKANKRAKTAADFAERVAEAVDGTPHQADADSICKFLEDAEQAIKKAGLALALLGKRVAEANYTITLKAHRSRGPILAVGERVEIKDTKRKASVAALAEKPGDVDDLHIGAIAGNSVRLVTSDKRTVTVIARAALKLAESVAAKAPAAAA